jgi:hypothetical protein
VVLSEIWDVLSERGFIWFGPKSALFRVWNFADSVALIFFYLLKRESGGGTMWKALTPYLNSLIFVHSETTVTKRWAIFGSWVLMLLSEIIDGPPEPRQHSLFYFGLQFGWQTCVLLSSHTFPDVFNQYKYSKTALLHEDIDIRQTNGIRSFTAVSQKSQYLTDYAQHIHC